MLVGQPLSGAADLQAGAVDDHVQRPLRQRRPGDRRQLDRATTDRRVVGHGELTANQLDEGRHQALGLAQRQLERVRGIRQVWIALSQYVACPRGVDRGAAVHASMAASVNHSVRPPRRRSPASYSAQFVTLNGILEMWFRRSALCLCGMAI